MRDGTEVKSASMTLTEAGNDALAAERTMAVTLNFPESTRALRTGVPRSPAACDSC